VRLPQRPARTPAPDLLPGGRLGWGGAAALHQPDRRNLHPLRHRPAKTALRPGPDRTQRAREDQADGTAAVILSLCSDPLPQGACYATVWAALKEGAFFPSLPSWEGARGRGLPCGAAPSPYPSPIKGEGKICAPAPSQVSCTQLPEEKELTPDTHTSLPTAPRCAKPDGTRLWGVLPQT